MMHFPAQISPAGFHNYAGGMRGVDGDVMLESFEAYVPQERL